jgi:hypothetical protein
MARTAESSHNRRMKTQPQIEEMPAPPARKPSRIAMLQSQIDERDDTIRQLNEALSIALDELNADRKAA